jgi:phenylalanyl-tRNA synthetase alpha chain
MDTLHEHEKLILAALKRKATLSEAELSKATGLQQASVAHASLWLSSKGLSTIKEDATEWLELNDEGKGYLANGFPERQAMRLADKPLPVAELAKALGASKSKIAMTWLMQGKLARVESGKITLTEEGRKALGSKMLQERVLDALGTKALETKDAAKELAKKAGITAGDATKALEYFKRRQMLRVSEKRERTVTLTKEGERVVAKGIKAEKETNVLTPAMLRTGEWKHTKFRAYDITGVAPPMRIGRRQPYKALLDEARDHLTSMGFIEVRGPIVETEFWVFDTLFQPQSHPTRTKSDTYYIKRPTKGELPKEYAAKVAKAHENGFGTGSTGWGYKWDAEKARQLILRTHTTAVSAHAMSDYGDVKGKYFTISRNFRRDVIDATHLPEFYQCDGIIVDPEMSFVQLLGMLKEFAREFAGTKEVKFVASYFPYTEPSVELHAKHPHLGWIELGGAGMFRPEVRAPAGIKSEVMAWGLGFDRLVMLKLGIKDIRELFSDDLKWLSETPLRQEAR